MTQPAGSAWRDHGVQVVPGSGLDLHTPQTAGMTRAAAITHARWVDPLHPHPESCAEAPVPSTPGTSS